MKLLSAWMASQRSRPPVKHVVNCDIDACDFGPRHQLVHEKLVAYLPRLVKRLSRNGSISFDAYGCPYFATASLPKWFLPLVCNAEAEEIIYEYLVNNYTDLVKDARVHLIGSHRPHLTVWFRNLNGE